MNQRRSRRAMTRLDLLIWVLMVAACAGMIIWSWIRFAPDAGPGPTPTRPSAKVQAPQIRMTDQEGQPFDSQSLRGKVWAIDFIFTNCPGPCPIMTGNLSALQDAIGPNPNVHLVSITCDPWRDDPATLKRYAESYGADLDQWTFLTGEFADVQKYAAAFLLTAENPRQAAESLQSAGDDHADSTAPGYHSGPIVHSSRIVLVNRQGEVYDWYLGTDAQDMQRLIGDMRILAAAGASQGRYGGLLKALPTVNASLNALAAVLLLIGRVLIRQGRKAAHMRCMIGAFLVSVVFLVSYVTYHTLRQMEQGLGHTKWEVDGLLRWVYYAILLSHVVLAAAVPFLAVRTLWLASSGRFAQHRRLAVVTWPIWMYVSVTGVLVYLMLYHLQPLLAAA
ncbi:MAG: DUF420 domain-containing protein [Phycisphaerales bacterium]|nr:DUF420 domain-containing protein [Phycisphaerales bacterium]